ncbi:unnamed protein product, partial [Musa textilis]
VETATCGCARLSPKRPLAGVRSCHRNGHSRVRAVACVCAVPTRLPPVAGDPYGRTQRCWQRCCTTIV